MSILGRGLRLSAKFSGGGGVEGTQYLWKLMRTLEARLRHREFKGNYQDEDQQCLCRGFRDSVPSGS